MKSHLGTYVTHYIAVALGALLTLSTLSPDTLKAVLAVMHLSPTVAVSIIGAAGAVVSFFHALGIDPPSAAPVIPPKQGGYVHLRMLALLTGMILAGIVANLTGCAALESALTNPVAQPFEQAAADAAVQLAVSHGVSAQMIVIVASEALALDKGSATSIDNVETFVNAKINNAPKIPAADKEALLILTSSLGAIAQQELQKVTGATPTVAIADVLNKIILAAQAQVSAAPTPTTSSAAASVS